MWGNGKPVLAFVLGDSGQHSLIEPSLAFLREGGIDYQVVCLASVSEIGEVEKFAAGAREAGIRAFIVHPGIDLHLASHVARKTDLPVIAVPMESGDCAALARMPKGVPVAVVGPGEAGSLNAVALALEILSVSDDTFLPALSSLRSEASKTETS